jgi:hypothetical protein
MKKVRGVRFSDSDEQIIESFLGKNPYLDFSMLVRISVMKFIEAPELKLVPVKAPPQKEEMNHVRSNHPAN